MAPRLAAVLVADVIGDHAAESGMSPALKALRETIVDPKFAEHRGRIARLLGEGMLVEFPDALDAVRAAVETQQAVARHNAGLPDDQRIEFRLGVELGAVEASGETGFGAAVVVAARLEEMAGPGGVCISQGVHAQLRGRIDVKFGDLGNKKIKAIKRRVRVWRWTAPVAGGAAQAAVPNKSMPPIPGQEKPRKSRKPKGRADDILLRDSVEPMAIPAGNQDRKSVAPLPLGEADSDRRQNGNPPDRPISTAPPREDSEEEEEEVLPRKRRISIYFWLLFVLIVSLGVWYYLAGEKEEIQAGVTGEIPTSNRSLPKPSPREPKTVRKEQFGNGYAENFRAATDGAPSPGELKTWPSDDFGIAGAGPGGIAAPGENWAWSTQDAAPETRGFDFSATAIRESIQAWFRDRSSADAERPRVDETKKQPVRLGGGAPGAPGDAGFGEPAALEATPSRPADGADSGTGNAGSGGTATPSGGGSAGGAGPGSQQLAEDVPGDGGGRSGGGRSGGSATGETLDTPPALQDETDKPAKECPSSTAEDRLSLETEHRRWIARMGIARQPNLIGAVAIAEALINPPSREAPRTRAAESRRVLDAPNINLSIVFDFDLARIGPAALAQLHEVGKALLSPKLREFNILVEGHTDSLGSEEYNMALSQRRAKTASRTLIGRFGVPPGRLSTRAMGETTPIDTNETAEGRHHNRRVTFINYHIGECEKDPG